MLLESPAANRVGAITRGVTAGFISVEKKEGFFSTTIRPLFCFYSRCALRTWVRRSPLIENSRILNQSEICCQTLNIQ